MNNRSFNYEKKRWDYLTKALLYATKCVKQGLIS